MAQRAVEPLLTVVTEGISTLVSPTHVLTPSVPLVTSEFHPLVFGAPLHPAGLGQAYAPLDPIIEATLVTTTRIPETVSTATDPQGYIIYGTNSAATTSSIGSLPFGQSMSLPIGYDPSPAFHFSIPTDGPPEMQYQRLMELA